MKEYSLYIHIPFCAKKCLYCDFASYSHQESSMLEYVKTLSREIEKYKAYTFNTIFIGGGTPTYLTLSCWKVLQEAIDELPKSSSLEFTVEGNPGSYDLAKLQLFKDMGVNRLSIGLQAWQNHLLKDLGRIHQVEDFIKSYEMARSLGFNNINIDVMFGLPNQTLCDWSETLSKVVQLSPEHISSYSLIVEEGTPFYDMLEQDRLKVPDEDVEREMYHAAVKMLADAGYHQYEISNFAKAGRQCRHNLTYWELKEYIGCGAAAHSYLKGTRYRNYEKIEEYIGSVQSKGDGIAESHENSAKEDMEEFMFMGLRKTEGILEVEFQKRFGITLHEKYGEVIKKYMCLGLLRKRNGNLALTSEGIELSNQVMADFLLEE